MRQFAQLTVGARDEIIACHFVTSVPPLEKAGQGQNAGSHPEFPLFHLG